MNFQTKSCVICRLIFALSILGCGQVRADLNTEEQSSLMGLIARVRDRAPTFDALVLNNGKKPVDYDRLALAYTIVYIEENGIVGNRVEDFFEKVKTELGQLPIPFYINYSDERSQMIEVLSKYTESNFKPNSTLVSSSIPRSLIGKTRTFAVLVYEGQIRLEKKTIYRFKSKSVTIDP